MDLTGILKQLKGVFRRYLKRRCGRFKNDSSSQKTQSGCSVARPDGQALMWETSLGSVNPSSSQSLDEASHALKRSTTNLLPQEREGLPHENRNPRPQSNRNGSFSAVPRGVPSAVRSRHPQQAYRGRLPDYRRSPINAIPATLAQRPGSVSTNYIAPNVIIPEYRKSQGPDLAQDVYPPIYYSLKSKRRKLYIRVQLPRTYTMSNVIRLHINDEYRELSLDSTEKYAGLKISLPESVDIRGLCAKCSSKSVTIKIPKLQSPP